ncbi:MAG: hypothetical protein IPJ79_04180 [Bacteroidetes bacterium]|nr:hypothetical protein [Bacteroidota bacterium]
MPGNVFQVYLALLTPTDSTKYDARPLNSLGIGAYIYATNVQYPLIARWDTSLFSSPILPAPYRHATLDNEYFFLVNNWVGHQYYNMTKVDTAYMPVFPWGSGQHFPLFFQADRVTSIVNKVNDKQAAIITPSIAENGYVEVSIQSTNIKCIEVYSCTMQLVSTINCNAPNAKNQHQYFEKRNVLFKNYKPIK